MSQRPGIIRKRKEERPNSTQPIPNDTKIRKTRRKKDRKKTADAGLAKKSESKVSRRGQ